MNTHDHAGMNHGKHGQGDINRLAASATLHCLVGCAIGEMIGITIGTSLGWAPHQTVLLAAGLSYLSGYATSTIPLLRAHVPFWPALRTVFAADTVSITTMTIVDNAMMLLIPGAMDKNMMHPMYWISRSAALGAAFVAAYPVNIYLLKRGKGHALMHKYHQKHGGHGGSK